MTRYRDAQLFPLTLRGRCRLATASELRAGGVGRHATSWRVATGRIRRLHRGRYLLGPHEPDLLDLARAALSLAPPGTVLGYQTAAALLGFGLDPAGHHSATHLPATHLPAVHLPAAHLPAVHLVVPDPGAFPQRPGIVVHRSTRPAGNPALARGLPCTPAARTAIDLARTLPREAGISIVDAALAGGACSRDDLTRELTLHIGLRGVRQARELVALADPRARSASESRLRLVLRDAGLGGLRPNVLVGPYRLDLADPQRRIGVLCTPDSVPDCAGTPEEVARREWLASHGWRIRAFTDRDIRERPDEVVRIVTAAVEQPR